METKNKRSAIMNISTSGKPSISTIPNNLAKPHENNKIGFVSKTIRSLPTKQEYTLFYWVMTISLAL